MKTTTIYSFPAALEGNDYQRRFYSLFPENIQIGVLSFSSFFRRNQILHIHWPEAWLWGSNFKKIRSLLLLIAVQISKFLLGWKVLYTCHNLVPHKTHPGFVGKIIKLIYLRIVRMADLVIHLTEAGRILAEEQYPWFKEKKSIVIRHPLYVATESNSSCVCFSSTENKTRISFVGRIRPYKGIEDFIDATLQYSAKDVIVTIAGKLPKNSEHLLNKVKLNEELFDVRTDFVPKEQFDGLLATTDLVVLPYLSGLNSGILYHVLSLGTPVMVYDTPVNRELREIFGSNWIILIKQGSLKSQLMEWYMRRSSSQSIKFDSICFYDSSIRVQILDMLKMI